MMRYRQRGRSAPCLKNINDQEGIWQKLGSMGEGLQDRASICRCTTMRAATNRGQSKPERRRRDAEASRRSSLRTWVNPTQSGDAPARKASGLSSLKGALKHPTFCLSTMSSTHPTSPNSPQPKKAAENGIVDPRSMPREVSHSCRSREAPPSCCQEAPPLREGGGAIHTAVWNGPGELFL